MDADEPGRAGRGRLDRAAGCGRAGDRVAERERAECHRPPGLAHALPCHLDHLWGPVVGAVGIAARGRPVRLERHGQRAGAAAQFDDGLRLGVMLSQERLEIGRPERVVDVRHHGVVAGGEGGVRISHNGGVGI